jgi:tRNA pseudouridine55 synthase
LAKKITYRERYTNKIIAQGEKVEASEKKERIIISPEKKQPYIDGKVLLINKPIHWTSFDVVRKLRSLLQIKKIGHAGTLDPLATGLLIVCTGKFTKKINEFMAQEKEYTGSITLGATTPTYDLESEPADFKDYTFVNDSLIQKTTEKFIGKIEQFPPVYSAIKKDGIALYELARRGVEVELKAREITISDFIITAVKLPVIEFKVVCSTGTYIRSLANDFGAALGCGGYLSSLCRTRIGSYTNDSAESMEKIEQDLHADITTGQNG